jgi:hypothetical protein
MRYLRLTGPIAQLRPSPALLVALLALFIALGGSAFAVTRINGSNIQNATISGKKLKMRTIKAKRVANDTLKGRQIDESTLGVVPRAASADVLETLPVETVRPRNSEVLFRSGPFTIVGSCEPVNPGPNQLDQIARVTLTSSEDGTAVSPGKTGDNPNAQLSANSPFTLSHVVASARGQTGFRNPTVDYAFDHGFEAFTPGQAAISGQIQPMSQFGPLPGSETNLCRFQGFVVNSGTPQP